MYYPNLSTLNSYTLMQSFIDELDIWLSPLPTSIQDRIRVESIVTTIFVPSDIEIV